MKRINITLSDELAASIEKLAEEKELSVAEITRRSLEIYLQRFPKIRAAGTRVPSFDLGQPLKKDLKNEVYKTRIKEVAR